ncbi:MAG: nodulation protein NfeD [Treponema sp.]|jgi:membrane-bound serine protease (ClpP class)|nr:nodulation protein NfeD [Treponema sp.]
MKPTLFSGILPAIFLLLCLTAAGSAVGQDAEAGPRNGAGSAWIIPIRGDIDPSMSVFVRRETRKALNQGASFIVFDIDTFGGRVDSALQITSFITSVKGARAVAWVHAGDESMGVSWSAGALIAFACADIYMASGTSIGAAAPVIMEATGSTQGAGEKTVSAIRSQIAALAERNGHPVNIALAMVDYDVELWEAAVDGETRVFTLAELERMEKDEALAVERIGEISPKGKLLSLTGGEAFRYGLVKALADDAAGLLTVMGATGEIGTSEPSAADGIISFLTSGAVQTILIVLGIVMIFLEINTPGFGIPGVTAIIAFAVVFGSGILLGKAGSAEIILFLLGAGFLAVEIFILPGFGFMGIAGLILIGLSLVLSMQDFVIPRFEWEWTLLGRNTVVVAIGLLASVAGIAAIALLGPKIRIFDRLTLKTRITGTAGGPADTDESAADGEAPGLQGYGGLVGKIGVAVTTLRPSGRVEIDGEVYSVEADGSFVEPGRGVRVTRVRGSVITVRLV